MSKEIFVRLRVADLVIPKEGYDKNESKYMVREVETYDPTYELEDGTECDEDGNPLE